MKIVKVEKLQQICMIKNNFIHITQKTNTKSWIIIKFNQKAWLKSYIDMNMELRQKAKKEFEKDFFNLMIHTVSERAVKNVRNHKYIELVIAEELSYNKKFYRKCFLAIEV